MEAMHMVAPAIFSVCGTLFTSSSQNPAMSAVHNAYNFGEKPLGFG
jgi:hypothetical protein